MGNLITTNPWVLDTASATALITTNVWIKRIVWHEPTTEAHTLLITDRVGNEIWSKTALAGGTGLDYDTGDINGIYEGFILKTLDSGTVFVYIR